MSTSRRNPIRDFDHALATELFGAGQVRSAGLLLEGACNSSYRVELASGALHVMRFYSRGDPARDAAVLQIARQVAPVPAIQARGPDWILMEWMPGAPLSADPSGLQDAARTLAGISRMRFEAPGFFDARGEIQPFPFGGFGGYVRDRLAHPVVQGWLGGPLMNALEALLAREKTLIDELDGQSQLVHADFHGSNILVSSGRVTAVLDWEFAHAGSPWMDVGNLLRRLPSGYHDTVARGLTEGGFPLPEDWKHRARLVDLTAQLEFLTSGHDDAFKAGCVARLEAFLGRRELP